MFCSKCGANIPNDAKFCPECGAKAAVFPGKTQTGANPSYQTPERKPWEEMPPAPSNGFAIAGFVLSLVAIFLFPYFIVQILALIFSGIGLSRADRLNGSGKGLAIAGIVISIILLIIAIIVWAIIGTTVFWGLSFLNYY